MSAGEFTTTGYTLDTGNGGGIATIKVQPETLLASINSVANGGTATTPTLPVRARARGGNNEYGIKARTVTLRFTGTPPEGYSGDDVSIPVMDESTYASWSLGQTGTYLETAVEVVGRSPERVR